MEHPDHYQSARDPVLRPGGGAQRLPVSANVHHRVHAGDRHRRAVRADEPAVRQLVGPDRRLGPRQEVRRVRFSQHLLLPTVARSRAVPRRRRRAPVQRHVRAQGDARGVRLRVMEPAEVHLAPG